MLSFLEFLTDLSNPALSFLPKALIVSMLSAAVCGVVGTHVVLRGMAFIGDAVSHAVFPGIAIAFVLQGSLFLGGALAGLVVAVLVAVLSQNRRVREDAVIGVLFAAAFALGLVIISLTPAYTGSLQSFLFGSITGIPTSDVYLVGIVAAIVVALTVMLGKELVAVSLDREMARALGLPVLRLDIVLYLLVTGAVVISVQTIGNILVLALLIAPPATARLLTDRLEVMLILSPLIGSGSAFIGLYLAWAAALPVGATIVLVATVAFALAWLFGPKGGLFSRPRAAARVSSRVSSGATSGAALPSSRTVSRPPLAYRAAPLPPRAASAAGRLSETQVLEPQNH